MLDVIGAFIEELRSAGLPISVRESIDASDAVMNLTLDDPVVLKAALKSTLVKHLEHVPSFDSAFEVYFSRRVMTADISSDEQIAPGEQSESTTTTPPDQAQVELDDAALTALVVRALRTGDRKIIQHGAAASVARYGEVEPARPVGVSYYLHRTLRGLGLDGLVASLLATQPTTDDTLGRRLSAEHYTTNAAVFRQEVEAEIQRLLIAGHGIDAVARSARRRLVQDVDFMHANADELVAMRKAVFPLARVLASRLAQRRRRLERGHLDFRATMRRSLSTGGVPIEPRFRAPHPARPEIFLLADISGSVAAFARFTVHLVYAMSVQFSKVRVAVFIDGVDEVTEILKRAPSMQDALDKISTEADVVHGDGHSDYGNALSLVAERYGASIGARTNVIILGDARNNYHAPNARALELLHRKARRVYWLNPEPRSYWGSGDSIMESYAKYCDAVYECRNLRQLKAFADDLVLHS